MDEQAAAPAGWYDDPHGQHAMRYWDGSAWTEHVSDGAAADDPSSTTSSSSTTTTLPDRPPEVLATVGEPAYEWSPKVTTTAKLLSKRARENARAGKVLRVFVGSRGIAITGPVRLAKNAGEEAGGDVAAAWDDVLAVWQDVTVHSVNGAYQYTDYTYTIRFRDGHIRKLTSTLRDAKASSKPLPVTTPGTAAPITVEQLGRIIQGQVTPRVFNDAVERVNRGEAVAFGTLRVDLQTIGNGEETLPWHDVEDVKIRQGVISVKKADKWRAWEKVTVPSVPNVFAFLELVTAIRQLHARQT
ncbi:MAG TPA: DUF2510 domain-containing protein [Acidimicrobiia bacterium]|nr:DUF2510 domain-containing protein [Acidimicrobiia bacterium]